MKNKEQQAEKDRLFQEALDNMWTKDEVEEMKKREEMEEMFKDMRSKSTNDDLEMATSMAINAIKKLGYKESNDKLSYELDFTFIKEMAERMEQNKGKYPAYQWWHKEMNMEEMMSGLKRHCFEVFEGEMEDDGNPLGHLVAIACNVMMIYRQFENFKK